MNLINGDCLEELKKIPDKSVDFVYTDLPYNQTACKWDQNVIDLDALWVQLKRIAKNDRTPFFFSCTTKFGYNLIKANEKWFRWDLVWKKNRAAGFLNAYKLPMRKHEMVYCFAKKCPDYDVSDHLTGEEVIKKADSNHIFLRNNRRDHKCFQKPHKSKTLKYPLPTTDITPPTPEHELVYCFAKKCPEYDVSSHKELLREKKNIGTPTNDVYGTPLNIVGKIYKDPLPTTDITPPTPEHELVYCFAKKCPEYDVSSHKDYVEEKKTRGESEMKVDLYHNNNVGVKSKTHKDPLPTSDITPPTPEHELVYCFAKKCPEYDVSNHKEYYEQTVYHKKTGVYGDKNEQVLSKVYKDPLPTSDITPPTPEHELVYCFAKKCPEYDVSSHKEYTEKKGEYINATDSQSTNSKCKTTKTTSKTHKDPLPTSDITPPELDPNGHADMYGVSKTGKRNQGKKDQERLPTSDITLPPIDIDIDEEQPPSSWCEVNNDEKTGHRTAKPVALMEFLLKYWTKPGWTVLDPTMGSGSMGIACKKMGRNFIGMELDDDIYKLAQKRISDTVVSQTDTSLTESSS